MPVTLALGSRSSANLTMGRLIVNMRRGSASGALQAWTHYASVEDARRVAGCWNLIAINVAVAGHVR